jgi:taurine dioxygenase
MSGLVIDRLTARTGAVIEGVDLRKIDDDVGAQIEAALLEHLVLFFPGQSLEPFEQLGFARRLGGLDTAPFGPKHPDVPEMTVLDQQAPVGEGADSWHSDNTFLAEPPKITMLQGVLLPDVGGDTCWSNMYTAYDALSEPMQQLLEGLTATHDLTKMLELAIARGNSDADLATMREAFPPQHHPVVRTHPETGRKALFVNGNFVSRIDQLANDESDHILGFLFDHVATPDFQCRFRWQPGTLTLWDNRCLQHYAVPDYASRRIMHRLTISGERPR